MKKLMNTLSLLFLVYVYGGIAGAIFHLLRKLRIIQVLNWRRFPHWQGKLILVSNHPSILETFLLPLLFFREYLLCPFKLSPWSTPDKNNWNSHWWSFFIAPRMIPVPRGNRCGEGRALLRMKEVVSAGGILVIFAEGGRTYKGTEFLCSKSGKRIRTLQTGVGWLALTTGAKVLPVWIEGADKVLPNQSGRLFSFPKFGHRLTIKIGSPVTFFGPSADKETATRAIAEALLKLADEQ